MYWLSQPGIHEDLAAARAGDHRGGEPDELVTTEALRERLNNRG